MKKKHRTTFDDPFLPMDLPPPELETEPKVKPIHNPIWTEHKARLIERYLYYFVLVTHHGTYLDGFAGPQKADKPEMWAAKLVLESEPRWLRHFYLFDVGKNQIEALQKLKAAQPSRDKRGRKINRDIHVQQGDFNKLVLALLETGEIKRNEAAFCLLDQRTFECKWSTLKSLAEYKSEGHKIELFYFLAVKWLKRAEAGLKDTKKLEDWWGRDDWPDLQGMKTEQIRDVFVSRIRQELGYKSVKPWPIYERQSGGSIMYYMIHATDHHQAPILMRRAYENAVKAKEPFEQMSLLDLLGNASSEDEAE